MCSLIDINIASQGDLSSVLYNDLRGRLSEQAIQFDERALRLTLMSEFVRQWMQNDKGTVSGNSDAEANVQECQPINGMEVSGPTVMACRLLPGEEYYFDQFFLWHNISSAVEHFLVG